MTRTQGHVALDIGAHLWAIAYPVFAGFVLAFIAIEALRRARLRWTWVLLGVPLAYLIWFIDWHAGIVLAIATVAAVWFGARTHAEAVQHGGEEARAMRDTTGPIRWTRHRLASSRAHENRQKGELLAIGPTRRRGVCRVPFGLRRGVHALITGATGSGKTVTQAAIAQAYVLAGMAVFVLDPKGDPRLRATLKRAAEQMGVGFSEWTPQGPSVYNPFARGGPTEIADKALAGHQWSEPHYKLATQRLLLHALNTMRAAGLWPPTISQLVAHMDPERLDALATKVGGETAERVSSYVDSLSTRARSDLGGGRDRLAVLTDTDLGPWLDPEFGSGEQIDLAESFRNGEVLYFHLDSDRFPVASQQLGAAILIDLIGLTADLQGAGLGGLLVIDEFAAIAAEQVSRLFARARSAGLSLLLGTQSLADLRGARPDDPSDTLTEQVLANVEFSVVHRVGDPDSAERFARMAGTVPAWSTTQRISGNGMMYANGEGTRTRQRDFLVLPDQFKRLATGEAVVVNSRAKRPAEIVRIWPPRAGVGEG